MQMEKLIKMDELKKMNKINLIKTFETNHKKQDLIEEKIAEFNNSLRILNYEQQVINKLIKEKDDEEKRIKIQMDKIKNERDNIDTIYWISVKTIYDIPNDSFNFSRSFIYKTTKTNDGYKFIFKNDYDYLTAKDLTTYRSDYKNEKDYKWTYGLSPITREPERTIPISQRPSPPTDNNDLLSILTEFNKNLKVPKMDLEDVKILSDEFQNMMKMNHSRSYTDEHGDKLYYYDKDRDGNIKGWDYKYCVYLYDINYIDERYISQTREQKREIRDMAQKIMNKFRKKFQGTKI